MLELLSSIPVIVFYIIFASQITVFAYYLDKMYKRIKYVTDKYPPTSHSKLYPNLTIEEAKIKVRNGLRFFKYMNIFSILVGITLIIVAIATEYEPLGSGEEDFIVLYAMLQLSPLIILEIGSFKHFKMMRMAYVNSTRKAQLKPRRYFDFISPFVFTIAAILFLSCMALGLFVEKGFFLITTLIGAHIYFAIIVVWNMYGKKLDPYQANKDRIKKISIVVKTSVFTSMAISTFFITNTLVDLFSLAYLDPLIMSVYFQLLVIFGIGTIFRTTKIEEFDFDVYQENQSVNS